MGKEEKGFREHFRKISEAQKEYFDERIDFYADRTISVFYYMVLSGFFATLCYQLINLYTVHEFRMVAACFKISALYIPLGILILICKKRGLYKELAFIVPLIIEIAIFTKMSYIDIYADPSLIEIYVSKVMIFGVVLFAIPWKTQLLVTTAQFIGYLTVASGVKAPEVFRLDAISLTAAYLFSVYVIYYQMANNYKYIQEQKQKEEEVRANRAKTAFLNNMSHDIRTPLNAITGMLHILEKNKHDETKVDDCIDKIRRSSAHLTALVDDVLDLSKLESDEMVLEIVPYKLSTIYEDLHAIYADLFKRKHIDYQVHIENIVFRTMYCSPLGIKRIVLNILNNAYKYTPEYGRVDLTLAELSFKNGVQVIEMRVSDNGIGMSKDFIKNHLFKTFSREDADLSSKGVHGSGLGLSITKLLIEKMGGTIEVESEQGVGTTFIVTVPFRIDTSNDEIEEAEAEVKTEIESLCGKHFLITEDNELNREILQFVLEAEGATVDIAENGQEAIELFAAHDPGTYDAILMDVNMPVMNGYEATKKIRALDREDAKSVIILAVTANAFADDVIRILDAGMSGHISKPLDPGKLKEKLMDH